MTEPRIPAAPDLPDQIGILGGTGPLGRGLARRWAESGISVVLGSRDATRAQTAAAELDHAAITGDDLHQAASCPVVVVAVPYAGASELLSGLAEALADRLVISCVNPLGFDAQGPFALSVPDGSAAQEAARLLPRSRVIASFHHLSAELLADREVAALDCDALVLGEDRADCAAGIAIANALPGVRGVYGGRLRNAGQVEAFTANLIAMNRRYKAHSGVRVTGLGT